MSLTRDKGLIVIECDDCDEVEETGTDDLRDALDHIETEGWTKKSVGHTWEHFCRSCSREL